MEKQELNIIYFAVNQDLVKNINDILGRQFRINHAVCDNPELPCQHIEERAWNLIVTRQTNSFIETNLLLTRINELLPLPPILLIYRVSFETQALHLFNTDTQIKGTISEAELYSLPIICNDCLKSKPLQTNWTENIDSVKLDPGLLDNFINTSEAGIWVVDNNINTTYVNSSMAHMLGYEPHEMQGKHISHFIDTDQIEINKRNINRRKIGINETHDFKFVRKDGTHVYVTMETTAIFDKNIFTGAIACCIDTTKKFQAEIKYIRINRALKATRACMQLVARARSEKFLLDDICNTIVKMGGYQMCWVGYMHDDKEKSVSVEASSGDEYYYLAKINVSWGDNAYGHGPTGTAIRTKKLRISRVISQDSNMVPWKFAVEESRFKSSIALPLIYENTTLGAISIYSDEIDVFDEDEQQLLQEISNELSFGIITIRERAARREAESELRQHKEKLEELVKERTQELEQSNRELESFSYSVSHDLRAPLRHISGYSSILRSDYFDQLDKDAIAMLERIENSAQNMDDLIDHLLNFARLNRYEINFEPVDLGEIAKEIKEQFSERINNRDVNIKIGQSLQANGDKQLLKLVLQNLVDNALKFTTLASSPEIEINVDSSFSPPAFFVRDNGVGFDMRYVSKIFGTFERLHTEKQFSGTGIGLASVKRIIERHGGKVWAEAALNKGTTIYFTLEQSGGTNLSAKPDTQ